MIFCILDYMQSIVENNTQYMINNKLIIIIHFIVSDGCLSMLMNTSSLWMAEIATIEATSFNFKIEKLTVPCHSGMSSWFLKSIFETKFSYPEKITIKSKFPAKERSMRDRIPVDRKSNRISTIITSFCIIKNCPLESTFMT